MSSDIYSKVQLSKKVRYTRNEQENRTDWEDKEVNIYESAEDVDDYYSVSQPQEDDQQTQRQPAVRKSSSRRVKLCKMLPWVIMSVAIITPAIYYIKSTPDLIQRVRYSKAKIEETAEWEEKKVNIYNYINDMMDDSQLGGGKQIENQPAANKVSARFATLSRRVMYILILAGIISLTVSFTLEIIKLKNMKNTISHLSDKGENYMLQLQAKLLEMAANYSQLHKSYEILSKNHNQLTDQVNRLNNTITGKRCPDGWTRFGSSCYFKGETTATWDYGKAYCEQEEAHLVIINSKAEQEFIKQFNKNGESWIGLQYKWIGGKRTYDWKWVDESPLTQSFWEEGWPIYTNYQSYAICCNSEGKWKQAYYYNYHNWICEK